MRCVLAFALTLAFAAPAFAGDIIDHGCAVPGGAKKVGAGRYEVRWNFDFTVKWYQKRFRGIEWVKKSTLINQPGVKAVHYSNGRATSEFLGVNIYNLKNTVRIYVIPREPAAPPAEKEKPPDGEK